MNNITEWVNGVKIQYSYKDGNNMMRECPMCNEIKEVYSGFGLRKKKEENYQRNQSDCETCRSKY
jgi:hypothetical protein